MFDALCDGLEGHFLGIRRGVELGPTLRRGNVFCYVYKRFFILSRFLRFLTFLKFYLNVFYIYGVRYVLVCPLAAVSRRRHSRRLTRTDRVDVGNSARSLDAHDMASAGTTSLRSGESTGRRLLWSTTPLLPTPLSDSQVSISLDTCSPMNPGV